MNKLLNANFHEMFKSKYFYLTVLICIFLGAFLTTGMYFYPDFNMPDNSEIVINKENVLGFVPSFATVIIPFAAAATVAAFLDSQYNHGTIRNMITCGHTRTEIFFSDLIAMSAATVIYFAFFQLTVFSVAVLAYDYNGFKLKATFVSLSVMLIMLICISTVLSLLLGNFMRGGKITVVILVVQYALNMSIVLGMFKSGNKVMELAARVFPQSSLFDFSYSVIPEGIEKNLILSLALIGIFSVIGIFHFKNCDIT